MPTDDATATPAIEVRDLHKSFGDLEVLKGVSMTARDGDVVTLIGASGSGKSTFLRCINMLDQPSAGEIVLAGEALSMKPGKGGLVATDRKQLERFRARLGMVFQQFNLWQHMTVLQNVVEGPIQILKVPKAQARERAEALLNRVGLWDKRDQYPAFLSGGQQQRAAIARALAMEPRVMLFDEPTSALDPELVGEVLRVIRSLAEEGRTMILVTHEMRFARDVSSEVMFLRNGLVDERGAPDQVFDAPESEHCRRFVQSVH
ncbi:ABC transporter ATP-binding protein [Jannaschia aquimarina]|uniref:OccP protein n=1 Tax=Jannaschia aquimarina TaxID=935700 RepID=A0A0D1EQF7_9RHOB|nr:ATP-binding cassette domain-containing protein [Jannaschia aquimarina]KIT17825.1 Octopine permease ATP-binding protein P [Jannaschia aquimarina]SNS90658.1 amino acid ABC transporter ATP-binding protein, PAAT family [Jannaschia aquimarina]